MPEILATAACASLMPLRDSSWAPMVCMATMERFCSIMVTFSDSRLAFATTSTPASWRLSASISKSSVVTLLSSIFTCRFTAVLYPMYFISMS